MIIERVISVSSFGVGWRGSRVSAEDKRWRAVDQELAPLKPEKAGPNPLEKRHRPALRDAHGTPMAV